MEVAETRFGRKSGPMLPSVFFFNAGVATALEDTLELIRLHGHVPQLVGCSGWGVIGSRREIEHQSGFSLILFSLPSESFSVVQISETQTEESTGAEYWRKATGFRPRMCTPGSSWRIPISGEPRVG